MRAVVIIIVVFSILVFVAVLANAVLVSQSGIVPPAQTAATLGPIATSSLPARLLIPALGINARVQYVGINGLGDMGTPNNFTDVAWYKNGVVPGQAGSAVMDGHVDNGLALAGVFKHLADIKVGDSVYVATEDGSQLHFVVYDIEIYPYKDVPMQTIFAQTDAAHLNVITCEGAWVPVGKTYDHRIVVYTKLAAA
jgi:LPXTG-site transpeptidase (sortase) family protein